MSWRIDNRAILEDAPEMGLHAVAVVATRDCGCVARLGVRLDKQEPTFTAIPCAAHALENERAMAAWKAMPPSERSVFELWEELLDAEIDAVIAR